MDRDGLATDNGWVREVPRAGLTTGHLWYPNVRACQYMSEKKKSRAKTKGTEKGKVVVVVVVVVMVIVVVVCAIPGVQISLGPILRPNLD